MWTMRFVGVRRPISAFGPPDATHFYVLYQFLLQHLFFIPEASLPIKDDTERGLDLAQEEVAVMASPLTRWMVTRSSALRRGSV